MPLLPRDNDELKRHTSEAAASVTPDMLERESQETGCSIDTCPVTKGTHILSLWCTTQILSVPLPNKVPFFVDSNSHSKICVSETVYFFCEHPIYPGYFV